MLTLDTVVKMIWLEWISVNIWPLIELNGIKMIHVADHNWLGQRQGLVWFGLFEEKEVHIIKENNILAFHTSEK